jgi:hypothetical protein
LRRSCAWRGAGVRGLQLPHESPLGQTLFRYFKQWPADSTADRIYDVLRDRVRDGAGWDPVASAAIVLPLVEIGSGTNFVMLSCGE